VSAVESDLSITVSTETKAATGSGAVITRASSRQHAWPFAIDSEYGPFCRTNRLEPSMSRRGNCWDNTVAESFFSSLKEERIKKRIDKSRDLATADISDYIESRMTSAVTLPSATATSIDP
jgi:transposase InsO family protein